MAFSFNAGDVQAKGHSGGKQRMQLTEAQREQLFKTRRSWELASFNRKQSIRVETNRCIRAAQTPLAYKECKTNQHREMRAIHEEGRVAINRTLNDLGLPPLPKHRAGKGRHH